MSGNAKFRFLLAPIVVALLVVVTSPVSWAGENSPYSPDPKTLQDLFPSYYNSELPRPEDFLSEVYKSLGLVKPDLRN